MWCRGSLAWCALALVVVVGCGGQSRVRGAGGGSGGSSGGGSPATGGNGNASAGNAVTAGAGKGAGEPSTESGGNAGADTVGGHDGGGAAGEPLGGAAGATSTDAECTRGTREGSGVWAGDNGDLETLRGYRELEGGIGLGANVTDLSALHCLESIAGSLSLSSASKLTTLDGLEKLVRVGGSLTTGYCDPEDDDCSSAEALTDLRALSRLTEVGRNLDLRGAGRLRSLAGLEHLTRVGDSLFLLELGITDVDGLRSLANVLNIWIVENSALASLEGLANLTTLPGYLYIVGNGASLTNLEGLQHLRGVGELYLQANHLQTLEGLRGLEVVHGTVMLDGLPELTDLNGLEGLAHIEGNLLIGACDSSDYFLDRVNDEEAVVACESRNDALENVDGLSGLTNLEGGLLVANNDELTSLAGLGNIDSIDHQNVVVIDNAKLTDFHELAGWKGVPESLVIADNEALTNVEDLSSLLIERNLFVLRNHSLTRLDGFPAWWSTMNGGLSIRENPALTYVHVLDGVDTLYGVRIEENESLVQLSGLGATSTSITLIHNKALESLEGLRNLQEVGLLRVEGTNLSDLTDLSALERAGSLTLTENPRLTSLRGLTKLTTVNYSLSVTGNTSLPDCEVAWLCAQHPSVECVSADNGGDVGTCDP